MNVRNDADSAVEVDVRDASWIVEPGEVRSLVVLPATAQLRPEPVTIRGAASCEDIGVVDLDWKDTLDPLIVIGSGWSLSVRSATVDERTSLQGVASPLPSGCPRPQMTWSLFVVNRSDRAFRLVMRPPEQGGTPLGDDAWFDIGPRATGSVAWKGVTSTESGPIRLVDPGSCDVVGEVTHPAVGESVVTITEGAELTIEPGAVPADAEPLLWEYPRGSPGPCVPQG